RRVSMPGTIFATNRRGNDDLGQLVCGAGQMLVDSHCHLDFADFAAERDAVVARARAAGVGTMLTIATRLDEYPGVREIADSYPDIWCSVGVHPHEAADHAALSAADLTRLA